MTMVMVKKKNPYAVALGRMTSVRKKKSSAANGRRGGRPSLYRWVGLGLQRREGEAWVPVPQPYDTAALAFIAREQRKTRTA